MTTSKRQFKDPHGHIVTLLGMDGGNVVFMRKNYPHPCQQPIEKFKAEFVEVKP
ncbi:MAG: DUF4222 domain-containing protein [Hafnia alvei]|uniref:DUF4222 domain-containing protein n=1 Tax=Hafnia TaxID=568 RepID=UPI00266D3CAE|nr:DUF4222 domain-containing protein [Hafnia paralvei]